MGEKFWHCEKRSPLKKLLLLILRNRRFWSFYSRVVIDRSIKHQAVQVASGHCCKVAGSHCHCFGVISVVAVIVARLVRDFVTFRFRHETRTLCCENRMTRRLLGLA